MSKKIKIELSKTIRTKEYKMAYDLGSLIGTVQAVLQYDAVDETAKRSLLRVLREIEDGESDYSKSRIANLEQLAAEKGFAFEIQNSQS